MKEEINKKQREIVRARRTRSKVLKISKIGKRLRLSVFRSNKYLYAQIIDDKLGKTVVNIDEKELREEKKLTGIERAQALGKLLAEKAKKKKISKVVFDKGPYKYHGRIKAFAETAKVGGLEF